MISACAFDGAVVSQSLCSPSLPLEVFKNMTLGHFHPRSGIPIRLLNMGLVRRQYAGLWKPPWLSLALHPLESDLPPDHAVRLFFSPACSHPIPAENGKGTIKVEVDVGVFLSYKEYDGR